MSSLTRLCLRKASVLIVAWGESSASCLSIRDRIFENLPGSSTRW
jgi:hypothetical protein